MILFRTYLIIIIICIIVILLYRALRPALDNFESSRPYEVAFVINLPGTKEGERSWKSMQKMEPVYGELVRFPGIRGKTYDYREEVNNGVVVEFWDIGKWKGTTSKIIPMEKSEIGISLSYYYLMKKIVDENIGVALILEDDATNIDPKFNELLTKYVAMLPDDWDMFLLGFWLHRGDNGYPVVNKDIYRVKDFCLLHAFMISNKGARKLLNHLPIDRPVDSWMSACAHDDLIIYRHNYVSNAKSNKPSSALVKQDRKRENKQIVNTNNW